MKHLNGLPRRGGVRPHRPSVRRMQHRRLGACLWNRCLPHQVEFDVEGALATRRWPEKHIDTTRKSFRFREDGTWDRVSPGTGPRRPRGSQYPTDERVDRWRCNRRRGAGWRPGRLGTWGGFGYRWRGGRRNAGTSLARGEEQSQHEDRDSHAAHRTSAGVQVVEAESDVLQVYGPCGLALPIPLEGTKIGPRQTGEAPSLGWPQLAHETVDEGVRLATVEEG